MATWIVSGPFLASSTLAFTFQLSTRVFAIIIFIIHGLLDIVARLLGKLWVRVRLTLGDWFGDYKFVTLLWTIELWTHVTFLRWIGGLCWEGVSLGMGTKWRVHLTIFTSIVIAIVTYVTSFGVRCIQVPCILDSHLYARQHSYNTTVWTLTYQS